MKGNTKDFFYNFYSKSRTVTTSIRNLKPWCNVILLIGDSMTYVYIYDNFRFLLCQQLGQRMTFSMLKVSNNVRIRSPKRIHSTIWSR